MRVSELANNLKSELLEFSDKLTTQQKMIVAIKLDITLATVNRYLDGDVGMTNLELAEQISDECKAIIESK